MSIQLPNRGELTPELLPAFRDRLERILVRQPFAFINDSSQLFDECELKRLTVSRGDNYGPQLNMIVDGNGSLFKLSVAKPDAKHKLYHSIRYQFTPLTLRVVAVPSYDPRNLAHFFFIGR